MSEAGDILDRAGAALLALAAERDWREIALIDIAAKAGVALSDLYPLADSPLAILAHLSARFDAAALAAPASPSGDVHDRLFDATMARIEAMEPHRVALTAIARAAGPVAFAPHLPRTAHAILAGAGLNATPPRLVAMTAVWTRTVHVWRDDEGALNRTMAEIDHRLKQMRSRLNLLGAGF